MTARVGDKGDAVGGQMAVTCKEAGVTLVTENVRDFARIARGLRFEFVGPWPTPSS